MDPKRYILNLTILVNYTISLLAPGIKINQPKWRYWNFQFEIFLVLSNEQVNFPVTPLYDYHLHLCKQL